MHGTSLANPSTSASHIDTPARLLHEGVKCAMKTISSSGSVRAFGWRRDDRRASEVWCYTIAFTTFGAGGVERTRVHGGFVEAGTADAARKLIHRTAREIARGAHERFGRTLDIRVI